jgi:hypothetical protein
MYHVTLHKSGSKASLEITETLEQASFYVTQYQDRHMMRASEAAKDHGLVRVDGKVTHRISYNGRIWPA